MPSDAEIDALIERIQEATRDIETGERLHEGVFAHVTVEDAEQAAAFLVALRDERDGLERGLRTVQNAAKTIASAQGTELEHLRQNRTYDYKLRQEHESLLERDAQMTDALLTAEAHVRELEQKLERARVALAETTEWLDDASHPYIHGTASAEGWNAEREARLNRARATLAEIGQRS